MTEWWPYTLSDFLLFSPRAYYRLIQRYNEEIWPAQLLMLGLGLTILFLLARPSPRQGHMISTLLAILWAWVAGAFFWNRYATINWAAAYVAPLFVLEAALLAWIGVLRRGTTFRSNRDPTARLGLGLFVCSFVFYPAIPPLTGRPWQQAEIFGIVPDPTVLATLGLLLLVEGRPRWELLAVPVLWCAISGATLWAMHSAEAWVPPAAAVLVTAASIWKHNRRSQIVADPAGPRLF